MRRVVPELEAERARIEAEAADWLVRQGDESFSTENRAAFEAWSASDPRRAWAFEAMSRTWRDAGELKHLAHLAESEPSGWLHKARQAMPVLPSAFRLAALAATVLAVFVFGGWLMSVVQEGHDTGVGQARSLRLSDGSTIVLGARSRVVVNFTDTERLVRLTAGEALFEVRHNTGRPFVVDAGDTVIRDVGTSFDVNRTAASVRVAVLEGEVEVRELGARDPGPVKVVQFLRGGDSLEITHRRLGYREQPGRAIVRATAPVGATAWREGRLVYQNARLGDVIADVNRYYAPGVTLDPASADLRVTASFRTNEIPAFLNTLGSAVPVRIEEGDGGHFDVTQR